LKQTKNSPVAGSGGPLASALGNANGTPIIASAQKLVRRCDRKRFGFIVAPLLIFCWFVFPLTEVLQEIRPDITRKVSIFLRSLRSRRQGTAAWQAPDRLEQKGTKRTSYWLADTNLKAWPSLRVRCSTNSHQLISPFVLIRVIRVFTRLRLNRATAWQAAAFPRKAFEMRERRVRPPRPDQALKCQRFRISSLAGRTRTFL
jgi:hypothetical protein